MKYTPTTLLAGLGTLGILPFAQAADFYWGTSVNQASWAVAGNWYQEAAGTNLATAAPGASDHAFFSITSLNGTPVVPRIVANTTVGGMTFNNTVLLNLHGGTNRTMTVGSGGVTNSGASVTIGSGTGGEGVLVRFGATQTWSNTDGTLQIRNSAASADGAGAVVVTLSANGTGNITNSGAYSDGTGSTLGFIVDSSGTGAVSMQSSTYSGGTTIKRGVLQANGVTIGTAAVKLGDTSGSANATLRINTNSTVTTGIDVQAGNTGVNTLEFANTAGDFGAGITLNNDLHVAVRQSGASGATITGVISGTGDLIKGQYLAGNSQRLTLAGANTYTGDTLINDGAFTLATTGSLTFKVGINGSSNKVSAAATNAGSVIFDGTFNFDLSTAALGDGNTWIIVDKALLTNASFSSTFAVANFTAEDDDVWTNGSGFTFTESTGYLTYAAIPEPSTFAILLGAGALGFGVVRRRRTA